MHRRTKPLPILAALGPLALLVTCQDAPNTATADSPMENDEPATRVESSQPELAGASAWHAATTPSAVYGGDPDEAKGFGQAGMGVVLSEGRLAAIDYPSNEIRFFGADGVRLNSAGGAGEGPGEFRNLFSLWRLPGDTLAALDVRLGRVTRLAPDGGLLGVVTIAAEPYPSQVVGALTDGTYVGRLRAAPEGDLPEGRAFSMDETYVRHGVDGSLLDTLAVLPGRRLVTVVSPDGRPGWGPVFTRFGPEPVSTVGNDRLYHGFSDKYEIAVYDPSGALIHTIRRAWQPNRLTAEIREASEEQTRAQTREMRPSALPDLERRFADAKYPETVPAFDWFVVDRSGNLWVRSVPLPGEATTIWSVFDVDGSWLTDVTLPAEQRPAIFDIGEDYLLAREADDLGLVSFARYALIKGG